MQSTAQGTHPSWALLSRCSFFPIPSAFPTVLCLILGFPSFQVFGGGGDYGYPYLYVYLLSSWDTSNFTVCRCFFFSLKFIVCSGYMERSLLIKLILLMNWSPFCTCMVWLGSLGVGYFWWEGDKREKGKMKFWRGSERSLALYGFLWMVYFHQKL